MKIFIYEELLLDQNIKLINDYFSKKFFLSQHLKYFQEIYSKLKQHQTFNPNEADYFLIPIFFIGWQFENLDPFKILNIDSSQFHKGKHILISTGDFGQRVKESYEVESKNNPNRAYFKNYSWLDKNYILIVFESTNSLYPEDIAIIPYINDEKVDPSHLVKRGKNQNIFASFCGEVIYTCLPISHIRGGKLYNLAKIDKDFLIGNPNEIKNILNEKITSRELISRSVFTLCPAGYGRWTYRWIEALSCGSIPVIISDGYILPFADKINWDDYVIKLPESELFNLPAMLKSMPHERILKMQDNILQSHHLFQREHVLNCLVDRLISNSKSNQKY
jgi:hypothetical protein